MTLTPALADSMNTRGLALGKTLLAGASQFYQDGFWHQDDESLWWFTNLCPASLAATMARYTTDDVLRPTYKRMAIESVERAIFYNLRPTTSVGSKLAASFAGGYEGLSDPSTDDQATFDTICSIGWIANQLMNSPGGLEPRYSSKWLATLKMNCVWLDKVNNNTIYYINGNFQAALCLAYYHVADLCKSLGDTAGYSEHLALYERAYTTLITPVANNAATWAGYGLISTVIGTTWDWSDYTSYLTETNGYVGPNPNPTLDYDYMTLSLDYLARLYVLKRDHRIMRLINAGHNAIASRINTSTWVIDETAGSRHNTSQGWVFAWLSVVRLVGLRSTNNTMFTDVNCTTAWDTQTIGSLQTGLSTAQVALGTLRRWSYCVATTIHVANVANKVIV